MAGAIDARLKEMGIELPEPAVPVANYVAYVVTGNLIFVSGQVPVVGGGRGPALRHQHHRPGQAGAGRRPRPGDPGGQARRLRQLDP
jgi:hypothetical protein